ncbi:conjugal transfer protein [Streptomyces longispororuber]|uniref:conjugal transfer protein n=1 Tax=Streptomyces longispororuber TaxID=68230 RepID=UPI00210E1529|nr:conjugal transfer protein [Streptomyces longispororuber]MCQ4210423.1 conjugal transfer protein [Streptomyces longispororuber]
MPAPSVEAPPTAAGVDLHRTRRNVRWGRAGVWACLLAGPAALALALTTPTAPRVAQAAPAPSQRPSAATAPADPSGYVVEFVDAWLRSAADAPDSVAAVRALRLAPGVLLPAPADAAKAPQRVTAVRSVQRAGGRWSVTVAAQYTDAVRYFAVPVTVSASGDAVTVTGVPALVAAPLSAKAAASGYPVDVTGGPLVDTVEDFLSAYLAGGGEVDRYLAPNTSLATVDPAVADRVDVDVVTAREESAAGEQVPGAGTRVHVQAAATARTVLGRWPLSYELTLVSRGGRWEIAALTSGGGEPQ